MVFPCSSSSFFQFFSSRCILTDVLASKLHLVFFFSQVSLKLEDLVVANRDLLELVFRVKEIYNKKLEVLNPVLQLLPGKRGPQASLLIHTVTDSPITLHDNEIIGLICTVAVKESDASEKRPLKG